jgi:predicted transcriptional regulator
MSLNMVEIDVKTIEALASGTRRIILKKLYVKPLTVSEVSRELNINKSAIYKHLSLLVDTGLVSKNDSENEFIYYELTAKGKK